MRRALGYIIYCFLSLSAFGQIDLAVSKIPDELKKGANAVIRYDRTIVDISRANKCIYQRSKAITVLNKKAKNELVFYVSYKDGSSKISSINIQYFNENGELIKKVGSKEIEDIASYDGFSVFTDFRNKYFSYEPSDYPITLKLSYNYETKNTFPPPWIPISDYKIAVQRSSYRLVKGEINDCRVFEKNFENFEIDKIGELDYKVENVKALKKEPYSPSTRETFPILMLSPKTFVYEGKKGGFTNWNELGKWRFDNFLSDRNDLYTTDVKREIDYIIGSEIEPRTVSELIYKYVQENTRYVNISLDEGALQPMKSKEVHETKYGDCKSLSFYMHSLLDLYGIPSNYVEIHASSSMPISYEKDFASAGQGNHVILNIPFEHDTAWIDCTSNDNPFDFLGAFTDDRYCLSINETGGSFVKSPSYSAQDNSIQINTDFVLSEAGDAIGNVDIVSIGLQMSDKWRSLDVDERERDKYLRNDLFRSFDVFEVLEDEFVRDIDKRSIEENYRISIEKFTVKASDYFIFPLDQFSLAVPNLGRKKERRFPICFPRAQSIEIEMQIALPKGSELIGGLEDVELKSAYGEYHFSIEMANGFIKIRRKFILNKGVFDASEIESVRGFLNEIKLNEAKKIAYKKLW